MELGEYLKIVKINQIAYAEIINVHKRQQVQNNYQELTATLNLMIFKFI